ncbi:glutaredoxin domain-containing protein [Sphingomonas sp. PAMC 26617]|uniref:glutaredoxin domain-containing protein n=1 Tax=Sphingomonas sp. PAMC 26617 TaxID=1112216 RepID=UPI0002898F43|nr:glutaredoxin domain-containing protein [Sphingomonas sp. PAMC 26617]
MTAASTKPTIYLKHNCPFCLKLRIFLTESRITPNAEYIVFDYGDDTHLKLRARMEAVGQTATFPAVEFEAGKLATGTDHLIERFASTADHAYSDTPLLAYYVDGVFSSYMDMFKQLRQLNA